MRIRYIVKAEILGQTGQSDDIFALPAHWESPTYTYSLLCALDQADVSQVQIRNVSEVKLHEKFNWEVFDYDAALALLKDELILGGT